MTLSLTTIIIFVQNVDRLRTFYVDLLKLEVVEETPSQWLLLKAGHCHIGLHKIGAPYAAADDKDFKFDNNTKIVFATEEDIYHWRELLLANNIIMQEVKTFDNYDYLLCDGEDPEGNVFQLQQRKK